MEDFILFDESAGESKKIIARNHQFLGVNRAIEAVRERKARHGKLGVFWHTQGSGKSYSMVMFTRKVHRKLGGNFTFLVLTDRDDLDTQIYRTFANCGVVSEEQGEVDKFRKWELNITPHRKLMKEGIDLPESMRAKPEYRNMQTMALDDAFKVEEHPLRTDFQQHYENIVSEYNRDPSSIS